MTHRNVQLVIFDLDGTLVDAYKAVSSSLNHALGVCGFDYLDDATIQRNVGWGEKVLIEKCVGGEAVDQVLSIYRGHHHKALKSGTKFMPGAQKLLDDLVKDGYTLAIATNRPSRFTHIILKHLEMKHYFKVVVCADQVAKPKPSCDMLDYILRKTRIDKDQTLYVGDMALDVETGNNAGVRSVAVTSGSNTREEIESLTPHAVIESISQLPDVIGSLG